MKAASTTHVLTCLYVVVATYWIDLEDREMFHLRTNQSTGWPQHRENMEFGC